MNRYTLEALLFKKPMGLKSRLKILIYKILGLKLGKKNRFEKGRIRRATQIELGNYNAFTSGYMLWPEDSPYIGKRIKIGNYNYFNRNIMIDACGSIEIGDNNMFGPDIYITDSNHSYNEHVSPRKLPMQKGKVIIGNNCWLGAKVVILKDVELGDNCVVGAGAVVTKSFPKGSVIGGIPAKILNIKKP